MIYEMEQPKTHQEDQLDLKAVLAIKECCNIICNNLRDSDNS